MKFLLSDIEIIQYFIKTGLVLGLTTYFEKTIKLWQTFILIICSVYYSYVAIWFIYYCVKITSEYSAPSGKVLTWLYSITFKAYPIVFVINMHIQRKNIKKLYSHFNIIERELNKRNVKQNGLQRKILFWLCINIFYVLWEFRFNLTDGVSDIYLINIMQYCIMFCILFMYVIFAYVKCKFLSLNSYILSLLTMDYYSLISHIKAVENLSRIICIVIKLLNQIFGLHIINLFLFIIVTVLTMANLAILSPETVDGIRFGLIRLLFLVSIKIKYNY